MMIKVSVWMDTCKLFSLSHILNPRSPVCEMFIYCFFLLHFTTVHYMTNKHFSGKESTHYPGKLSIFILYPKPPSISTSKWVSFSDFIHFFLIVFQSNILILILTLIRTWFFFLFFQFAFKVFKRNFLILIGGFLMYCLNLY